VSQFFLEAWVSSEDDAFTFCRPCFRSLIRLSISASDLSVAGTIMILSVCSSQVNESVSLAARKP
jgi:hypothetical protein